MARQTIWKGVFQFLIGIFVSAGILIWLAQTTRHNAEGFEAGDIIAIVRGIPLWVILLALILQLFQIGLRTMRYSLFLRQRDVVPDFKRLLAVTFVRNMFVDLLPSRMGELSYVILLKRMLGERVAKGIASMGASFAFDLIALLVLIVGVLSISKIAHSGIAYLPLVILLGIVIFVVCYLFFFGFSQGMRITQNFRYRWLTKRFLQRLNRIAEETDASIRTIRQQHDLWKVFLLSMGIRIIKYSSMLLLLYSILNASFLAMEANKLGSLFFGIAAGEASASMPIPTFMSFGTYEAGASFTLQGLGYSVQASVIAIFVTHLISQSIDYSLGIGALWLSWALGWFGKTGTSRRVSWRVFRWFAASVFFLLLSGMIVLALVKQSRIEKDQLAEGNPVPSSVTLPADGKNPKTKEDGEAVAVDRPSGPAGFAVWATNRFGNHEIVQYDLRSRDLKRLTHTLEMEYYPSISPGGRYIVFARSHKTDWRSRQLKGWSIVLLDLDSGEERVLATEGFHPSWAGDDAHILYSRNGKQILLLDLETGQETLLVEAGQNGVPSGYDFFTPSYNPIDGSVAVTIRGSRRTKYLFDRKGQPAVELPQGCQLAWMPNNEQLIYTGSGEIKHNAFHLVNPARQTQLLLDVPGDYSHEYFPRVSNDGKWLIFGASSEGHAHDTADYEIFLWRVGMGTDAIQRLSHDPANDSWPDIYIRPQE